MGRTPNTPLLTFAILVWHLCVALGVLFLVKFCHLPTKKFRYKKKKKSVNPSQIIFFPNLLLNFSNKIFFFLLQGLNGCEFKTNGKSVGCIGQNILQFTCKITSVIMKIMNYAGHHPLTPTRLYKEVLHSSPPLPSPP